MIMSRLRYVRDAPGLPRLQRYETCTILCSKPLDAWCEEQNYAFGHRR